MTNDLISRKAGIDSAKEGLCDFFGLHADDIKFPITNTDYLVLALNKNITARINSLPSAEPRWIPVTERLPDHEKPVIICTKDGYIDCDFCFFMDDDTREWACYDPIAWMETPEPYRKENNAD